MNSSHLDSDFLLENYTSVSECKSFDDSDDKENIADYSNVNSYINNN